MKSVYETYQGRGKDSLLHRNLRMCTEEGVFATPFVVLSIPGNLFIAALLTSVLGISERSYGLIVSLPAWANALQIIFIPLLSPRLSSRSLTIFFSLLNALTWLLLLGTIHLVPQDNAVAASRLLFAYFVLISLTQSMAGVSWMSWIQEWIPERIRGKYFGRRNGIIGFTTVAFIVFAGLAFELYGESLRTFQIIIGITVGLRFLSIYLQTHIYTPWSEPDRMIHVGWLGRYSEIKKNQPFMRYLTFAATLAFFFSFTGPFVPVFMARHLDFSVSYQTILLIVANLASAVAMPFWGKLCDRYGCRPVITLTAIGWMSVNFIWVVITPAFTWVLYPMWLVGGTLSGGVILGGFNLVLKLAPSESKSTAISLHLAVTSVAAALAPIIAGNIIALNHVFNLSELSAYRIIFFIQPTFVLLSLLLLRRVNEPKMRHINAFSGAFRTMRLVLVQNGLFLAGNITLFRRIKEKAKAVLNSDQE